MIRVLQVIHSMHLGGAENFIMNVYRSIDRSQIQFDFLVNCPGEFDAEIERLGGKVWMIPYVNRVGPLRYRAELNRFFSQHQEYHIVHSHLDMVSGEVVSCAKKNGIPCCFTHSHNTATTGNYAVKALKRFYQKKINRYADVRLACSKQAGKWLYGNADFQVVNNAIDMDRFSYDEACRKWLRMKYGISGQTCVIGHVGRFSKVKNHVFLIGLFEKYMENHHHVLLLLCGDGEEKTAVQRLVGDRGFSDKVIFFPAATDVYKMYQMMDIFVFPSLFEGMSLAMVEAQTNGLPVVASDSIDPKSALTENVRFVSLQAGLDVWVRAMDEARQRARRDEKDKIFDAGFDIHKTALMLQSCYLDAAGESI